MYEKKIDMQGECIIKRLSLCWRGSELQVARALTYFNLSLTPTFVFLDTLIIGVSEVKCLPCSTAFSIVGFITVYRVIVVCNV